MRILYIVIFTILSFSYVKADIKSEIEALISSKNLTLGLAICEIDTDSCITINGQERFPMQSVYKLHIALALLDQIDMGKYSLADSIEITTSDLLPNTWSPFRDSYPMGRKTCLEELIEYILIKSDNNITDVLISMAGGPSQVDAYIKGLGLSETSIKSYERELKSDWNLQFANYTTPEEAISLLKMANNGDLLSRSSNDFIIERMEQTFTGSIRDSIPREVVVAHKTGFSGAGTDGIIQANNDIGIMRLPNGKEIAFAILITEAEEDSPTTYKLIAQIGAIIYNHYK